MKAEALNAVHALNQSFLRQHPLQAMQALGRLPLEDLSELMREQPVTGQLAIWNALMPDVAVALLPHLSDRVLSNVLQRGEPVHTSRILVRLDAGQRDTMMQQVDEARQRELDTLVSYPENSAGALMDPRFMLLQEHYSVREALRRLRKLKPSFTRQLYIVDQGGRLQSMVEIQKLALADSVELLSNLSRPVPAMVPATATREEVVALLQEQRITDLPVVDLDGRLIGVIRYDALINAVREESSVDMLTMVGASREERALSNVSFVVKKRLPWLSINLLTAFLAASVVGLFESTIAQFTALAVLLPVVAGQSGNTGAQALAVTMRGLALREIGTSQWLRVARKEIGAGFVNGVAIAVLTSVGVLVWSASVGLALVIGISMVIAMVAAAFSGVVIPVTLQSLGQDPAQSSSIVLTTVTDVVGFFAFLGIATLLASMI